MHVFICILSHLAEGGLDPSELSRTSSGLLCGNAGTSVPLGHRWRACLQGKASAVTRKSSTSQRKRLCYMEVYLPGTQVESYTGVVIQLEFTSQLDQIVSPVSSLSISLTLCFQNISGLFPYLPLNVLNVKQILCHTAIKCPPMESPTYVEGSGPEQRCARLTDSATTALLFLA